MNLEWPDVTKNTWIGWGEIWKGLEATIKGWREMKKTFPIPTRLSWTCLIFLFDAWFHISNESLPSIPGFICLLYSYIHNSYVHIFMCSFLYSYDLSYDHIIITINLHMHLHPQHIYTMLSNQRSVRRPQWSSFRWVKTWLPPHKVRRSWRLSPSKMEGLANPGFFSREFPSLKIYKDDLGVGFFNVFNVHRFIPIWGRFHFD